MKYLSYAVIASALFISGCKTNSVEDAQAKADNGESATHTAKVEKRVKDKGIKCRSEAPTGSRIAKMRCTTKEQRQARSKAAKHVIGDVVNNQVGALKGPIGGGGE